MSQYTDMTYAKKKNQSAKFISKTKSAKSSMLAKTDDINLIIHNLLHHQKKSWCRNSMITTSITHQKISTSSGCSIVQKPKSYLRKRLKRTSEFGTRFIADTELARMQIAEIKPVHVMKLFQIWTGNGKITRKDFNNRKSVLNGIFRHAVLNEIITFSPITDLPCNTLKFKLPNASKKAYTVEERVCYCLI